VTIDPLTVAAVPILLTILYGAKYLRGLDNANFKFLHDLDNESFKAAVLALILIFVCILGFFHLNYRRKGLGSFFVDPTAVHETGVWHYAVILMVPIALGLLIYFLIDD
jgi:hypothetical protein